MKLRVLFLAPLAFGSALVAGQQTADPGKAFVDALTASGLTMLSQVVTNFTQAIGPVLAKGGNMTLLAPTNAAFKKLGSMPSAQQLPAILAYHLVNGSLSYENLHKAPGNRIVAPTELIGSPLVNMLQQPQVVVVQASNSTSDKAEIPNPLADEVASFANTTDGPRLGNVLIQPIDHFLTIPGNLSSILQEDGDLSTIRALLGRNQTVDILSSTPSITLFAPEDKAVANATGALSKATTQDIANILANHVLNGTVAYTTWIQSGQIKADQTSASGESVKFRTEGNETFVSSGSIEARIIKADILTNNGVVHVVDRVLVNTQSNPAAAATAADTARKNSISKSSQGGHKDATTPSPNIPAAAVYAAFIVAAFYLTM